MLTQNLWLSRLKFLAVLFILGLLAIYFRTYQVHGGPFVSFRSSTSLARDVVERAMKSQILNAIEKNDPRILAPQREHLASLQTERLKVENRTQYEQAVRNAAAEIEAKRKEEPKYLLEADPYHYYYLTERLLETGRIADVRRAGEFFQPLMRAPHGHWEPISLHPYVGLGCYHLLRLFNPNISLIQAVAYVPLLLTLLVLVAYAILAKGLKLSLSASVIGMTTVVLSPIYIQRSAFGWFDTDPYNYIFPIVILSCVLMAMRGTGKNIVGALFAGFFTGLYALFWSGWAFMLLLVPVCFLTGVLGLFFVERRQILGLVKEALRFLIIYLGTSLFFLGLFLTPAGLLNCFRVGWDALNRFALASSDIWPNIFLTVGEANGIGLKKLIFLSGNYLTFGLAIVGFFLESWCAFKKGERYEKFRLLFLTAFSLPILLMSLKTERFSLLFVLPLAIFTGLAVMRLVQIALSLSKANHLPAIFNKDIFRKGAVLFLVMLGFFPMTLLSAHLVAGGIQPIMDDVWNSALVELRQKTPADAIVNSWWPPGYFVTAVARRAVVGDGGTQHFRETYWMSRALMAEDEREAVGIFRMLNLSGNSAMDFLTRSGVDVADAIDLLLKMAVKTRQEALELLPGWMSTDQKNELLDKTHGKGSPRSACVLVYNDLIDQNLAVSVIARWDFRKAQKLAAQKQRHHRGVLGVLVKDAGQKYVNEMLTISGSFLKYTSISPLANRAGDQLIFRNEVRVDLKTLDVWVGVSAEGAVGHPGSFFYIENGKWVEKTYDRDAPEASVLLLEEGGVYYGVLADARLIRSLLFRLYYLQGQGLSFFKPLVAKGSFAGGTVVKVFEIDYKKLASSDHAS